MCMHRGRVDYDATNLGYRDYRQGGYWNMIGYYQGSISRKSLVFL